MKLEEIKEYVKSRVSELNTQGITDQVELMNILLKEIKVKFNYSVLHPQGFGISSVKWGEDGYITVESGYNV